jgi:short-subunit dehydrogenase/wyosine [tRNA(Phe)-imidazoG37] synthetase (radical SAM superfamily)
MAKNFYSAKNILITGATGDLGRTLVKKLAAAEARLIISSRSEAQLAELAAELPLAASVILLTADLSVPGAAARLAEQALEKAGHIDLLFNNAGLGYFALMEEADEQKIRHLFEVNTFSPFSLIQALLPHMSMRGTGRIVNIVSSAGRVPIPTVGVYGGSKSALAVMANTMRLELEPKGIDILNIYPGTINDSFEKNAMREGNRPGLCSTADCGEAEENIAAQILDAAAGPSGEVWLEKTGKWLALAAIAWPSMVDNRLRGLRNKVLHESDSQKPHKYRRWRLWQVESSLACNLQCIMCPWTGERQSLGSRGHMAEEVWSALVPYLHDVGSVDFTGGGEPLLQKKLLDWIREAKRHGCDAGFLTNGLLLNSSLADQLIDNGLNWICFSIDGADKATYETIRRGSDFDTVCANIAYLTASRSNMRPLTMINFVIMKNNFHQLEDIIRLAAELGADQVNYKQCDVIRGDHGKGFGLFGPTETEGIKQLAHALDKAKRLARRLDIKVTSFSFLPEEQPVCDQDPRNSLFIRYDGSVSPCINLAIGGPSTFLGEDMVFPHVSYGRLSQDNLADIWESEGCLFYRRTFEQRVKIHGLVLDKADYGRSIEKLNEAFEAAIRSMPEAPQSCVKCHYLYDI